MSIDYTYLKETYPEWYPDSRGEVLIPIFLVIAFFLIVPYIYVRFIEPGLFTESEHIKDLIKNLRKSN